MTVQYKNVAGEKLSDLPVDKEIPNDNHIKIINGLFQENNTIQTIINDSKDTILVGLIIIMLSMSQIDTLIRKYVVITQKSDYILYLVKGLLGAFIFWLIKHFYLSRK